MAIGILNQVQKLDQQVPVTGPITDKCQNLAMCLIIQLAALGGFAPLAFAGFPDALAIVQWCHADLQKFARAFSRQMSSGNHIVKLNVRNAQ
jgi:hypothetical protein